MSQAVRIIAVLVIMITLCAVGSAQTFHGDAARTGNFSDYGPKTGQLVYRLALNPIHGSPVVASGTVFVIADYSWGGDNSRTGLYAVNSTNGTVLWHYGGIYGMSTPAVYDSYVFVHAYNERSGDGELMSFFTANGTLRWNVTVDPSVSSWVVSSSPLIYNGSIYVLSYYGRLYKFDLNGSEIWNLTLGSTASSTYMSSPSAWNGVIYVAVNDSGTYRLVAVSENGAEIWNATLMGVPKATPAIYGGTVFLPTSERIYGFNATNGNEIWNISFDGTLSTPAVANGRIYVANKTTIFCFDIASRQELWNFTALPNAGAWDSIASSPAVADGLVYFATNAANGTIFALNATSGQLVWSYETDNYIMSSPFVDNGKLYIGADDGNLYIFGLWKGTLTIEPGTFSVTDDSGNTYVVSNFTVLGVLQKLKEVAGINYTVYLSPYDNESLFLSSLADIGLGSGWWMTEVNGQGISRGMQFENVSDGDVVTFWLYPANAPWGSVSAENAPYLVEVAVKGKLADVNNLQAGNGVRGGFINATVNLTPYYTGWVVVVVSGTNSNGDSIAGISAVKVEHGRTINVPVMLAIPQQAQTGTYDLYVGVYRLDEFPSSIKAYTTSPKSITVS